MCRLIECLHSAIEPRQGRPLLDSLKPREGRALFAIEESV